MPGRNGRKYLIILFLFLLVVGSALFIFRNELEEYYSLFNYARKFDFSAFTKSFQDEYILPEQKLLDVRRYLIKLKINFAAETITAKTTVFLKKKGSKSGEIILNFRKGLTIDSVKYNNKRAEYWWDNDHLFISGVTGDSAKLEFYYRGKPANLGLGSFVFSKINGKKYLYTINEPVYASCWLPCNDLPEDKVLTEVVIDVPAPFKAISNGILLSVNKNNGRNIFTWKTLNPISTYLIAIYAGEYSEIKGRVNIGNKKLLIDNFVFPEDSLAALQDLKILKKGLKIFSKLFGEYPYINEKYGVVEITWPLGGIENQTAVGIGEKYFTGENLFQDLFLHELAHQWWGDAVTLKNWNELWLNEGFAVYSVGLFNEMEYGERTLQAFMYAKKENFEKGTLEKPGKYALSNLLYYKGAWLLHMLRNKIGDDAFLTLLKQYFKKFKYKNATTNEFLKLAESISGKNLKYFFNQWLIHKGIIKLIIDWKSNKIKGNNYLTRMNLKQNGDFKKYKFNIEFKLMNKEQNKSEIRLFNIISKDTTLVINTTFAVDSLEADPSVRLLAEIKISKFEQTE